MEGSGTVGRSVFCSVGSSIFPSVSASFSVYYSEISIGLSVSNKGSSLIGSNLISWGSDVF